MVLLADCVTSAASIILHVLVRILLKEDCLLPKDKILFHNLEVMSFSTEKRVTFFNFFLEMTESFWLKP